MLSAWLKLGGLNINRFYCAYLEITQNRVLECLTIRILCPVNLHCIYSNNLSINSIHYVIIHVFLDFQPFKACSGGDLLW